MSDYPSSDARTLRAHAPVSTLADIDALDAAASACAAAGDHAQAYALARQAGAARDAVLQHTSATLAHLSAVGHEITTHLDAATVMRALDRHVHGLLEATHFSVYVIDADGSTLRRAFGTEAGQMLPSVRVNFTDPADSVARCVRERREIHVVDPGTDASTDARTDASTDARTDASATMASQLYTPMLIGTRALGALCVQSTTAQAYGERERHIFRTLSAHGAIALDNADAYRQVAATLKALSAAQAQLQGKNLELEQAYKALEDVSLTDQLTGLRNRRFFLQHVEGDVGMSLRSYDAPLRSALPERDQVPGKDLVFFMVDLDHFKEVNDRHGHAAGDAVLVQMQERLREVFRESDYLIRWGGEEFLVLARATRRDDARVVAERIRNAVARRPFVLPDGQALTKTCSIGFACFPFVPAEPRLLGWSDVVELADQALYVVKRSGRNAWAGIYSTPETHFEDLVPRLIHQLDDSLASGQARMVTSLETVHSAAGPKTRRLVPEAGADLIPAN